MFQDESFWGGSAKETKGNPKGKRQKTWDFFFVDVLSEEFTEYEIETDVYIFLVKKRI